MARPAMSIAEAEARGSQRWMMGAVAAPAREEAAGFDHRDADGDEDGGETEAEGDDEEEAEGRCGAARRR